MADINENRPGYKKTKVGWIPEEWQTTTLGKSTSLITNGFVGKATTHYSTDEDSIIYIQGYNVKANSFNMKGVKRVSKSFHQKNSKSILKAGDLLTVQTGDVGLTAIVTPELEGANCHALIISRFLNSYSSQFYSQYFNSPKGRASLKRIETGSTMKHLNVRDMKKWSIPLPPLPEQKKIAAILSTWDAAIRKLDRLIERKQTLKKGLMQQLLTGRRRFPEFVPPGGTRYQETKLGLVPEDWEVVKMNHLFKERKETGFEDLELLSIGNDGIYPQSESDKRDISNKNKSKYKRILPGDIGYNTMRMWQGRSAVSELEGIVSPAYTIITPSKQVDIKFAGYFFKFPAVIYLFWRYSQGMVADTLNLKYRNFSEIKLPWPSKDEQVKVAESLFFLDKQIEKLEKKKQQLEQQKKGLMQQLLTGAVRVRP